MRPARWLSGSVTRQVKCCVLMLDWNDEDIICDLFQVLCEAIK